MGSHLIDYLVRQPFPLNVRELYGLLLLAIHASPGDKVKLPPVTSMASTPASTSGSPSKAEIEACLERTGGNVAKAARLLKIDRNALQRRIDAYGIKKRKDG